MIVVRNISLSANSPKGAVLPQGAAGVVVAKYDITANGDDVKVTSLTIGRDGIGDEDNLAEIAVFGPNGVRLSKEQSFNSDDEATVSFYNGGFVVEAGETATISIVATVDTVANINTDTASGDRVAVSIKSASAIASNATEVVGDFPATGSIFEIGSQAAGELTIEDDGSIADVKIGEENVVIAKFKVTADDVEDISLNSITLKENGTADESSDFSNISLYLDGNKVADGEKSDKYFSFTFDSPILIEKSKNKKFQVRADITGGAAKIITLELDKNLDVSANGSKYGYGAAIVDSITGTKTATINAGALTIVKVDAANDEILADKDDVVFGKIKVIVNAGKDLEMEKFKITLTEDAIAATSLENVELYNENTGAVYDLTANGTAFEDTDLGITLQNGQTYTFAVRADTIAGMAADKVFAMDIASIGGTSCAAGNGICVKETDDDNYLDDITPSSITFKSITSVSSSATLVSLPLSSKTAVRGAKDVVAYDGEISAGSADDLKITEFVLSAQQDTTPNAVTTADTDSDSTLISVIKLWKKEGTNETLLAQKSGSQLSNGEVTFDNLSVAVAADEKVRFIVTADVVDDENNEDVVFEFFAVSAEIEDTDSDTVALTVDGTNNTSAREITVTGAGELSVVVDNTDTEIASKSKYVLGGTTSDFVASFELLSQNEGTKIKDLELEVAEVSGDFINSIESVSIYANDKTTLLATESVSSTTVLFDNINHIVGTSTENIYVKVKARKMGKNEAGAEGEFTIVLDVVDSEGADSGNDNDTGVANTAASQSFLTAPVQISNVEFVSSFGGDTVSTTLANTVNKVAILKVTTASTENTNGTNGSTLKTILDTLNLDLNVGGAGISATTVTIEKIGGNDSAVTMNAGDIEQVQTLTFNQDIVATESIDVDVDGVTLTQAFDTNNDTTIAALAVQIAAKAGVNTAVVTDNGTSDHVIVITAADASADVVIDNISITTTDGLTATVAETTESVVAIADYVANLAADMTTDSELENGTSTYFLVKATIAGITNDTAASVKVTLDSLDAGSIKFTSNDTTNYTTVYDALNIKGKSTLDATTITQ